MATKAPPIALIVPTTSKTFTAKGENRRSGITLSKTKAPQVTTAELRRIEAGFGPSMASSSQRCIGNWAHLPIGPAIKPKPIKLPANGDKAPLAVAVALHSYRSLNSKDPAHAERATMPINSNTSPTRFVRNASRAAVTTNGCAYQKPTSKYVDKVSISNRKKLKNKLLLKTTPAIAPSKKPTRA